MTSAELRWPAEMGPARRLRCYHTPSVFLIRRCWRPRWWCAPRADQLTNDFERLEKLLEVPGVQIQVSPKSDCLRVTALGRDRARPAHEHWPGLPHQSINYW